ncbi:MAG: hypothetical protein JXM70_20790 [Pirellulales bacterium]|nr:hypothetical protein [Pirellulales bacterium]
MAKKTLATLAADIAGKTVDATIDVLDGWAALRKSNNAGRVNEVRDDLSRRGLNPDLADIFAGFPSLISNLKKTIAAGETMEEPQDLVDLLIHIKKMSPATVADAKGQGQEIIDLQSRIRAAEQAKSAALNAQMYLGGLKAAFGELVDGSTSKPLRRAGSVLIPPNIMNGLLAIGLDADDLIDQPWHTAFRLQTSQQKRRRLVARA